MNHAPQLWYQWLRKQTFIGSPSQVDSIKFHKAICGKEKKTIASCSYGPRPDAFKGITSVAFL